MTTHRYAKLAHNINQTIYEGLLKIGYTDNETFSIYYDLDLLNHLLETNHETNESLYSYLHDFYLGDNPYHPYAYITLEKGRFKITISTDGIRKINEDNKDNTFLKNIISLVQTHQFTLNDVIDIFEQTGKEYVCIESQNSEFQYVLYFKDETFDPFRYCFSFDLMGGYYHRLLEYDYQKLSLE